MPLLMRQRPPLHAKGIGIFQRRGISPCAHPAVVSVFVRFGCIHHAEFALTVPTRQRSLPAIAFPFVAQRNKHAVHPDIQQLHSLVQRFQQTVGEMRFPLRLVFCPQSVPYRAGNSLHTRRRQRDRNLLNLVERLRHIGQSDFQLFALRGD